MNKPKNALPMKAIVSGIMLLFGALVSLFLIIPAFFDVHITEALFEKPPPPWELPVEVQSILEMSEPEMRGLHEFKEYCAACHGRFGEGGGPQAARIGGVPNLLEPTSPLKNGLSDEGLIQTINEGVPGSAMPSFVHISERVKNSLLDYLRYARQNADRLARIDPQNLP